MFNSDDPAMNAAMIVLVLMVGIMLVTMVVFVGAIVAVPAGIGFVGWRIYKAKKNRPIPTLSLVAADQERIRKAEFPKADDFLGSHLERFLESCGNEFPANAVYLAYADLVGNLYRFEELSNPLPPLQTFANPIEEGRYRDQVIAHMKKLDDPNRTLLLIHQTFANTIALFMRYLPQMAKQTSDQYFADEPPSFAAVPAFETIKRVPELVHELSRLYFANDLIEHGIFAEMRRVLQGNVETMSGDGKPLSAIDYKGTSTEIIEGYLAGTPLLDLFLAPVPFSVPDRPYRMEHTFILGGSGAGKTTLIQNILLQDLAKDDPPGMVIIDPKGKLVERIQQLKVFDDRLKERIVIVDPADTPALNMFAASPRTYPGDVQQEIESQAISNFAYVFSSLNSPMTQKQAVCFTFCVRLLFKVPGATINTLMELLNDPLQFPKSPRQSAEASPFWPHIQKLDETSRQFFIGDYYSNFLETRDQIKARLYGIISHPRLAAMFSTTERKLDLFDCLVNRKIVLVNAAMDTPGSESSQLIARYFVALTLNAAFEAGRKVNKGKLNEAHLIVDEFQLVSDELKTPEMLTLAREYNLGICMAFQSIHGKPFNDSLRVQLSTNTSVKYASSPEGVDIDYAARDLRTDKEWIRAQTKTATHAKFGVFVRGLLDQPVSLSIPFGNIEAEPQMSEAALRALLQRNREQLSMPAAQPLKSAQESEPVVPTDPTSRTGARTPDPDAGEHTDAAGKWGS